MGTRPWLLCLIFGSHAYINFAVPYTRGPASNAKAASPGSEKRTLIPHVRMVKARFLDRLCCVGAIPIGPDPMLTRFAPSNISGDRPV